MYKKSIDAITGQESENIIKRKSDNASIPKDPNNKDYQEYPCARSAFHGYSQGTNTGGNNDAVGSLGAREDGAGS